MGAGKTTIGKQLARQLQLTFMDVDHVLVERTGADIPTIFEYEGEQGFRQRETRLLEELTQQTGLLLATGGGAVLREENHLLLQNNGTIIYLKADPKLQLARIGKDKNRPLLQTDNPLTTLENLQLEREFLYLQLCDFSFDTRTHTVNSLLELIMSQLNEHVS